MIISGPIILLGALAYRSAKRRWLGQVASTKVRCLLEAVAIGIILFSMLRLPNLHELVISQPFHYVLIPVWALTAYVLVGFRSPKVQSTSATP